MSNDLVRKMIEALRDMSAKLDETVEREDPESISEIWRSGAANRQIRTVIEPRFDRSWVKGRLLGMADMAEALIPTPTDTGGR